MKALIRGSEIVTDEDNIDWIDWETGMPLTSPYWYGGKFELVQDYVPVIENDEANKEEEIAELEARLAALKGDL